LDFWQLGEDKEPAACLTGAQYWQRKAEGEESHRPMPPVSTLLRSHPSEPHVADPIMVLGKRIRQAAHPVANLSPRTRAPASPRSHRLSKFQLRAEGRAIAIPAESRALIILAVLLLPSPRAVSRRPCHPLSPSSQERRRAVLAERLSVLTEWLSSPSGHPLLSIVPWPSLAEHRAVLSPLLTVANDSF